MFIFDMQVPHESIRIYGTIRLTFLDVDVRDSVVLEKFTIWMVGKIRIITFIISINFFNDNRLKLYKKCKKIWSPVKLSGAFCLLSRNCI